MNKTFKILLILITILISICILNTYEVYGQIKVGDKGRIWQLNGTSGTPNTHTGSRAIVRVEINGKSYYGTCCSSAVNDSENVSSQRGDCYCKKHYETESGIGKSCRMENMEL